MSIEKTAQYKKQTTKNNKTKKSVYAMTESSYKRSKKMCFYTIVAVTDHIIQQHVKRNGSTKSIKLGKAK